MPTAAEQFMPELIRTLRSYAPTVTADTDAQGRESSIPSGTRATAAGVCSSYAPTSPTGMENCTDRSGSGRSRSPVTCLPEKPTIPYRRY